MFPNTKDNITPLPDNMEQAQGQSVNSYLHYTGMEQCHNVPIAKYSARLGHTSWDRTSAPVNCTYHASTPQQVLVDTPLLKHDTYRMAPDKSTFQSPNNSIDPVPNDCTSAPANCTCQATSAHQSLMDSSTHLLQTDTSNATKYANTFLTPVNNAFSTPTYCTSAPVSCTSLAHNNKCKMTPDTDKCQTQDRPSPSESSSILIVPNKLDTPSRIMPPCLRYSRCTLKWCCKVVICLFYTVYFVFLLFGHLLPHLVSIF